MAAISHVKSLRLVAQEIGEVAVLAEHQKNIARKNKSDTGCG
jgi:hypothetical protein